MALVLSSVPLVRVRVIRTANNTLPAGQRIKATPTVRSLSVAGQHGFIDPLDDVLSTLDGQTGVDYLDLVATDDPDVAESFGWTISLVGSARAARIVSVPQSGSIVEQITVPDAQGGGTHQMPAVWLHQLADFTGPSGATGSDLASRTYVDDSIYALQQAPDPFPQYAMDGEGGGGSSTPDATTGVKGKARLLGGTADNPTVPWSSVTGAPAIPASYTDEQAQDAAGAALTGQSGKVSATYDDGNNHVVLDVQNLTKADVGLNNVNNTADANKPVSTSQQAALDLKANLAALAAVALSGAYGDLSGRPAIPATYGDLSGTVPASALPALAINDTFVVADQTAMLALTAQRGDIAIRQDRITAQQPAVYILGAEGATTLANWILLPVPADAVASVAGRTGAVTLGKGDVGLGSVDNTADVDKPVSTATQTALDTKTAKLTQRSTAATAATTAAANEIVPLDTTGGTFALTGPSSGAPFGARWRAGTAPPTIAAPVGYTIAGAASLSMGLAPGGSTGELVVWQAFGTDYQPVGGFKPQAALNAILERGTAGLVYLDPAGSDTNAGLTRSTPKLTLTAALAALPSGAGTIDLAPGTYNFGAADSFIIDPSLVSLRCRSTAILQWGAAPTAGYAIWLRSTSTYAQRPTRLWKTALDGIVIAGNRGAPYAGIGVKTGDPTLLETVLLRLRNGGIEGFEYGYTCELNTWRHAWHSFHIRACPHVITQPTTVPDGNSGENMTAWDCMFESTGDLYGIEILSTGDWHFFGCSLDNCPLTVDKSARVYLHGSHHENPNTNKPEGSRLATVNGDGYLAYEGCEFILNPGTSGFFGMSPFAVADTNKLGLRFADCQIPAQPWVKPERTESHGQHLLVAGRGRVTSTGMSQNDNFQGYGLSAGMGNHLRNGDAETGTIAGWASAGTGVTADTDTSTFHSGTRSFRVQAANGTTRDLTQAIRVRPGEWVWGSMWRKATITDSSQLITIGVEWLDNATTTVISTSLGSSITATDATWVEKHLCAIAPPGAVQARLKCYVSGGTASGTTATLNVDDVVMAVV